MAKNEFVVFHAHSLIIIKLDQQSSTTTVFLLKVQHENNNIA